MADATDDKGTQPATTGSSPEGQSVTADAAHWQTEAKKAFQARDEAKKRLAELEAAAEKARLAEVEKNQAYKAELDKVLPEYQTLKQWRAEYDKRMDESIAESEAKLAGEAKEEYERFIKALPAEQRLSWLARKAATPTATDSPAAARPGATGKAKPPQSMSFEERVALRRTDPAAYKKLFG